MMQTKREEEFLFPFIVSSFFILYTVLVVVYDVA
jgi:hypothetical protein